MLGTSERRSAIAKLLCRRRHETITNLALEFGVSERTIRRDVETLSHSMPLYTYPGRYNGGVYIIDGYTIERMYMYEHELAVLQKLSLAAQENDSILTDEEKKILHSIISLYSKPQSQKRREI